MTILDVTSMYPAAINANERTLLTPEYDSEAVCGATSLGLDAQRQLDEILFAEAVERRAGELLQALWRNIDTNTDAPKGKKLGVWVDGVLKLQSRDRSKIDDYAEKMMRPRTIVRKDGGAYVTTHNVWVAPVRSFVPPMTDAEIKAVD